MSDVPLGRVLVVDDEPSLRLAMKFLGEQVGWDVVDVGSAEEAIEAMKREDFDAILTDKNLPGLSGIELLRWAREQGNDAVCVVLTADPSGQAALESLELGVDGFIPKPIPDLETFAERVNSLMRARTRRRRGEQGPLLPFERKSLMVVSANSTLRERARSELRDLPQSPQVAENVGEAMAVLESEPPTVALMDLELTIDEVLKVVQAARGWAAGTRFVLLGALAPDLDDVRRLIALGVCDYIQVPWSDGELLEEAERALERPVGYAGDQSNPEIKLDFD